MLIIHVPRNTTATVIAALGLAFDEVTVEPHDGPLTVSANTDIEASEAMVVARACLECET